MGYTIKELSLKSPYYISKERRLELEHFCKQYPEWVKVVNGLNLIYHSTNEVKTTDISDATYINARARALMRYTNKISFIDDALAASIEDMIDIYHMQIDYQAVYDAMLKLITKGGSYEKSDLPNHISEYRYRELRRRFFYILSIRRN